MMADMKYAKSTEVNGEEVKKDLIKRKPNARSLSKFKLVHSRTEDADDTLIIRNTWNNARLARFGVKGQEKIRELFNALLALICKHKDEIMPTLKYEHDELEFIVNSLANREMTDGLGSALGRIYQVNFIHTAHLVQIELLQMSEDATIVNGVMLFVGEVLKLIKYINNTFFRGDERENEEWASRHAVSETYAQSHDSDTFF